MQADVGCETINAMRSSDFARVTVVAAATFAAAASATAPKPPGTYNVQRTANINTPLDTTWQALIDLFAAHSWPIDKIDKASGLVTTDWIAVNAADASEYADCGSNPLAASISTGIKFNVTVRENAGGSVLTVNADFRQAKAGSPSYACSSKGTVETMIQTRVRERAVQLAAKGSDGGRKTVSGAHALFCLVTAPDVGRCYATNDDCAATQTEGGPVCEQHTAGSCFTATKILDSTKATTCAVSIKDCETRRAVVAADPDYKVTPCGVYRMKKE